MAASSDSFLEAVSEQLDYWTDAIAAALTDDGDHSWIEHQDELSALRKRKDGDPAAIDPRPLVREWLTGLIHSMLTIIDEGSPRQDLPPLRIDADGAQFAPGLHERFIAYLIDTGRIKPGDDEWLNEALNRSVDASTKDNDA